MEYHSPFSMLCNQFIRLPVEKQYEEIGKLSYKVGIFDFLRRNQNESGQDFLRRTYEKGLEKLIPGEVSDYIKEFQNTIKDFSVKSTDRGLASSSVLSEDNPSILTRSRRILEGICHRRPARLEDWNKGGGSPGFSEKLKPKIKIQFKKGKKSPKSKADPKNSEAKDKASNGGPN